MEDYKLEPEVQIGHIHLKVADLERSIEFYCEALGFEITQRYGSDAVFISAGGYHHHIGLNTWKSKNGSPPPENSTGLFHFAIKYPNRKALAKALFRLTKKEIQITGAADHGVSEAIYLNDPDQNGIELYWNRPKDEWPKDSSGNINMYTKRLDLDALLSEIDK